MIWGVDTAPGRPAGLVPRSGRVGRWTRASSRAEPPAGALTGAPGVQARGEHDLRGSLATAPLTLSCHFFTIYTLKVTSLLQMGKEATVKTEHSPTISSADASNSLTCVPSDRWQRRRVSTGHMPPPHQNEEALRQKRDISHGISFLHGTQEGSAHHVRGDQ